MSAAIIERLRAENDYEERDRYWAALVSCAEALENWRRLADKIVASGNFEPGELNAMDAQNRAALAALERAGK